MDPFSENKDPMDALTALRQRVNEVLKPLGISVEQLWFAPSADGGPHMAQGVFLVDREAAFKSQEQQEIDKAFKEMAVREQYEKEQEKVENARSGLEDMLKQIEDNGGSFLDDSDDAGT